MFNQRKRRFKPLYKQLIALRESVQNRKKIFKFKKQKWKKFIYYEQSKLKPYKKIKSYDQINYAVSQYPNKWDSYYKGKYRNVLKTYKKFALFYGGFTRRSIKKYINFTLKKTKTANINLFFLKLFESRLDTVLFRAKFGLSMRSSRQLISHGKIFVNNKKINSKLFYLKTGDTISVDSRCKNILQVNIARSNWWPIPPKHLIINYRTFQIIFGTLNKYSNTSTQFTFNLNLEKLLVDYLNQ